MTVRIASRGISDTREDSLLSMNVSTILYAIYASIIKGDGFRKRADIDGDNAKGKSLRKGFFGDAVDNVKVITEN